LDTPLYSCKLCAKHFSYSYLAEIKVFWIMATCTGKLLKGFSYSKDGRSVTFWAQKPFLMLAYAKKRGQSVQEKQAWNFSMDL
jgi:hypothetical protein